ncbi:MAG: tetratricopeptide repeat protein [Desulfamplus sp.]|nr:tetratricopeptide repeat protein [Desulfamplus sp.]
MRFVKISIYIKILTVPLFVFVFMTFSGCTLFTNVYPGGNAGDSVSDDAAEKTPGQAIDEHAPAVEYPAVEDEKSGGDTTGGHEDFEDDVVPGNIMEGETLSERDHYDQGPAYYHYMKFELQKSKGDTDGALNSLHRALALDPDSLFLHQNLIFFYLALKDETKAEEAAEEMVQRHPHDTSALLLLAKIKRQMNLEDEARELYQQIIQKDADNRDIYIVLGNMYIEKGYFDDAFRIFSRMSRVFPDDYVAYFFLGRIHLEKKNYLYAEKAFARCIELNQELVEPRFELISVYKHLDAPGRKKRQSHKKIVSLYQEILDLEPDNIRALVEMPIYLLQNDQRSKASVMFRDLSEKNRKNPAITMALAKEFIGNERYMDAATLFTEMLNSDPDNDSLNYLAGLAFSGIKQSTRAVEHFLKVSQNSEQYKKAVVHAAYLYKKMNEDDKAMEFLEKKHEELPRDIDLMAYLAAIYEEKGMLDDALRLLRRALDYSPEDREILFRSGVVLDKLGDKETCIKTMRRLIAIDAEHAGALNYLGYTYAEMGENLHEAEELIIRALEIKPHDAYITDSLGWVYYKKGMYERAVEILEKAEKLSSGNGDSVIAEHLGDAYKALDMIQDALGAYGRALDAAEDDERRSLLQDKIDELKGNGTEDNQPEENETRDNQP